MTLRATDPYAALRHPPFLLPAAATVAFAEYLGSLYGRRDDLPGALRADLAGAGRLFSALAGGSHARWSPPPAVADLGSGRLFRLHEGNGATSTPLLVVVPQGTHPAALLGGDRSVAGALAAAGAPVYAVDWAAGRGRDDGIEEIIGALRRALDHLGGEAHLIGCSQGGWLSVIIASLRPSSVASLTLVGAPVTFHAGGPAAEATRALATVRRLPPVDSAVRAWLPWWAGWQHVALSGDVWWVVDPLGEAARLVRALGRVGDDDETSAAVTQLAMFTGAEPMSCRMYEWFAEHLIQDDALFRGVLEIRGSPADPARITCPVRLIAGARDTLVSPRQVRAAARAFPGAERVEQLVVDADHLELFTTAAGHWASDWAGDRAGRAGPGAD